MSHMVIYRASDGKPGYHQVEELSAAIKYVEHLRNDQGVDRARIFRMEEVTFEFRPYYRVEVGGAAVAVVPGSADDTTAATPPPPPPLWDAPVDDAPPAAPVPAATPEAVPAAASEDPVWADAPVGDLDEPHDREVSAAGFGNRRGLFGR